MYKPIDDRILENLLATKILRSVDNDAFNTIYLDLECQIQTFRYRVLEEIKENYETSR